VAPSEPMRALLLDYGISARIQVIPTGLPAERFVAGDGARFRANFGIAADRLNYLQFLTIRRYLSLVFATLVTLLLVLAIWS